VRPGRSATYEAAERAQVLDLRPIADLLARSNGHGGRGPLTALLDYDPTAAAGAISELERLFLDLLCAHDVPLPLTNVLVGGFFVDVYWPEADLVVELDSYEFHKDRATFESDRRKWTTLQLAGHHLLVFTYRHAVDDPVWVVASVTDLLAPFRLPVRCRS
jgi:hypothetical protein